MPQALELAARIRQGEITSVELTTRCIARIRKVNGLCNAVVAPRFQAALEEAAHADAAVTHRTVPDRSPLWGVPCLVKECFELPGMPFTAGIWARRGSVGVQPCPALQRVMDAGMPILGVTNVSEACMFHESNNPIYGLTRNPFDLGQSHLFFIYTALLRFA